MKPELIHATSREMAIVTLSELFEKNPRVLPYQLYAEHDIHGFYHLTSDPQRVIHVQAYPGLSTNKEMQVWARLLDNQKVQEIRRKGGVSIGNEHDATIRNFPNFGNGIRIGYDSDELEKLIAENFGGRI